MPLSRAEAALVEARIRTNEWIAAQKSDRASAARSARRWAILSVVASCVCFLALGYLIGTEGKRAFGLVAFVGLSGLATALVWGIRVIERDE